MGMSPEMQLFLWTILFLMNTAVGVFTVRNKMKVLNFMTPPINYFFFYKMLPLFIEMGLGFFELWAILAFFLGYLFW